MNVFDLQATISLSTDGFEQNLRNAQKKFESFGKNIKSAYSDIGDLLTPLLDGFKAVESVGQKAAGGVATMLKGFTAAATVVGGFGASAVKTGGEFDTAMSQVMATMGYTVEELNDESSNAYKTLQMLKNSALDLSTATSFSATEAARAYNYMALAGYDAKTAMKMLPSVLSLAAAGSIDLASASDMVTDSQTALNLSLDETSTMIDQMAVTSTKSNTSVAQLGDAILTVGGTAKYMAGGTAELNAVLGALADSSIKGTEGGTKLRNIILSLSAPTKNGAAVIRQLGLEVFDADGKMRSFSEIFPELNAALSELTDQQKIDALSTIFNNRDIAAVEALLGTTTDRWRELGDAILDAEGAAEKMAAVQLDNLQGDVTLLKSAFDALQITISDALTPSIREFAQFGSKSMDELRKGFQENGVTGFMSALTGIVTDGVTMLAQRAPEFVSVSFRFVEAMASGILEAKDSIIKAFNESANVLISGADNWLSQNGASLYDFGMGMINSIFNAFSSAGDLISKHIGQFVPLMSNAFLSYHETLFTLGMDILGAIGQGIVESKESIQEIASSAIAKMVTALSENAPDVIEGGLALLDALVGAILDNAYMIGETAVDIISDLAASIGQAAPNLIPAAIEAVIKFAEGLTGPQSINSLIDGALDLIEGIVGGLVKAAPLLIEYAPEIVANIVTGIISAIPQLVEVGGQLIGGLIEGLVQAVVSIPSAISKVGGAVVDGFKSLFGIHSPSTVFAEIGENLMLGMSEGIGVNAQMKM